MIKALSAVAIAAFIAASITLLPSFAPPVEASVPHALAKSDKLPVRTLSNACAGQNWPNIDVSCLRRSDAQGRIQPARIVTANRG